MARNSEITRRQRQRAFMTVVIAAGVAGAPHAIPAQLPVPPGTPPGAPADSAWLTTPGRYRPPALVLVQPPVGGSIPQDRPVVVFRFTPGELADPVDARSFAVVVDGEDRSALFQVSASEAWGRIAPIPDGGHAGIALGAHQVAARICSVRGACGEIVATVTIVASPASVAETSEVGRKRSLLELLLEAAKRLLAGP